MGKIILIGVLVAFLVASFLFAWVGWNLHGEDVAMSGHGYAAMALGIVFSLVIGGGLMGLVFYSSRKGYDEPAEREHRPNE
jgi:hypothetical protein